MVIRKTEGRNIQPVMSIYKLSACLSLGMAMLIHLFSLLVIVFNRDAITSDILTHVPAMSNRVMLGFNFLAISVFLFIIFVLVFKILASNLRFRPLFIIVGVTLATFICFCCEMIAYAKVFGADELPTFRAMRGSLVAHIFLSFIAVMICYIAYVSRKQEVTALENEALVSENMKSRYQALRNQMDPHFLFNTLSSLTSMIEMDPPRAQEYALKMSSVFRYTLQNHDVVTLEDELRFAKDYCSLIQIRYDKNLVFDFDVEGSYNCWYVVPLSIQTLIENAIKHNVISNSTPLVVTVRTNPDNTLTVVNDIQSKKAAVPGEGIGLANLAERYVLKWQR